MNSTNIYNASKKVSKTNKLIKKSNFSFILYKNKRVKIKVIKTVKYWEKVIKNSGKLIT